MESALESTVGGAFRRPRRRARPDGRDHRARVRRASPRHRLRRVGTVRHGRRRLARTSGDAARRPLARGRHPGRAPRARPRRWASRGPYRRRASRRGRRGRGLRADAHHRVQGPGPRAGARRRGAGAPRAAGGPARHPAVDDLPGHHHRPVPRGAGADRPPGRRGLRPGLRPRARQPGRPGERRPATSRALSARRRPRRPGGPPPCCGTPTTGSWSSARPTPPRWPSCSRTRSATSTSRS